MLQWAMFDLFFYFLEYVMELKDIFEEKKYAGLPKSVGNNFGCLEYVYFVLWWHVVLFSFAGQLMLFLMSGVF